MSDSQNIYDDPDFFAGYSRLSRSVEGLEGAPEWPALRALLPALSGLRVLDLGCGFGWFCRWAREAGAFSVAGVDLSENMLERARSFPSEGIAYVRADLESFVPPLAAFDLVYSSLAFHYLSDLGGLLGRVRDALVPGGRLVFSVEHPIFTAPSRPEFVTLEGRTVWPVDGYLAEGPRTTDWLAPGVVKQHRTIGTYVNLLSSLGFSIERVEEWGPSLDQVAEHPEWAAERDRPPFLLISASYTGLD